MMPNDPRRWLLLIHQIPPKPNALRVRIWRRLQQVGAVGIKPSVYAMPVSEQCREDLSWILNEIVEGGGDGSISEVRFLEGLTDEQV
ncbi:MAG TPA: ChrB protein, partial [Syntrophobacteraceae bacterium]|nr:ChrB protein [Syntrophobacteraceae bacterium]